LNQRAMHCDNLSQNAGAPHRGLCTVGPDAQPMGLWARILL